ncbi:MAG TPA: trypsin-like peptidase domain-containing protein [Gemmataceae bacterium]|jgi:serine protease Do|nr:trypsin-like peptidase domain-containing protein [Gemmataceae bacterium]
MLRSLLVAVFAVLASLSALARDGEDKNSFVDIAQVYEKALQEVIKQADPSIACILVSRSDAYKKIFHDEPPADNPGKLGAFDTSKAEPLPAAKRRGWRGPMRDAANPQDELEKLYDLSRKENVPESFGSGVVIAAPPAGTHGSDGKELLILTNYHVVHEASKIFVCLAESAESAKRNRRNGSYADIYAADPRSDLAVLRLIDAGVGPLQPIKFGDADQLQKGSFVVSLAFPYGVADPTASKGIVSNLHDAAFGAPWEDREKNARPLYKYKCLIKADTKLNAGCSGGALLNLKAEMVGLTTARAMLGGSDTAAGFAIPIDKRMKRIIDKLKAGEEVEYGFLGVTSPKPEEPGLVDIVPRSPAAKAGMRTGDLVVSVAGERVRDAEDIFFTVATSLADSTVRIEVRRLEVGGRRSQSFDVTLAKSYVPGKIIASNRPAPIRGMRVDHTSIMDRGVVPFRARGFSDIAFQPGVLVAELQPGSPAALQLHLNDIVTHVRTDKGPMPVNTPKEFYQLAGSIPAAEPLELTLLNSESVIIR